MHLLVMNIPILPLGDVRLIIHRMICHCFHYEQLTTTTNPHPPACTPSISAFVTSSKWKSMQEVYEYFFCLSDFL